MHGIEPRVRYERVEHPQSGLDKAAYVIGGLASAVFLMLGVCGTLELAAQWPTVVLGAGLTGCLALLGRKVGEMKNGTLAGVVYAIFVLALISFAVYQSGTIPGVEGHLFPQWEPLLVGGILTYSLFALHHFYNKYHSPVVRYVLHPDSPAPPTALPIATPPPVTNDQFYHNGDDLIPIPVLATLLTTDNQSNAPPSALPSGDNNTSLPQDMPPPSAEPASDVPPPLDFLHNYNSLPVPLPLPD